MREIHSCSAVQQAVNMKTKSNFMHYNNRGNLSNKTIICHMPFASSLTPPHKLSKFLEIHAFYHIVLVTTNSLCFQGTETMLGVEGLDPALLALAKVDQLLGGLTTCSSLDSDIFDALDCRGSLENTI